MKFFNYSGVTFHLCTCDFAQWYEKYIEYIYSHWIKVSFWEVGLCVLSSASDAFTVKGKIVLHLFTCSQSSSYVILFIIIYF